MSYYHQQLRDQNNYQYDIYLHITIHTPFFLFLCFYLLFYCFFIFFFLCFFHHRNPNQRNNNKPISNNSQQPQRSPIPSSNPHYHQLPPSMIQNNVCNHALFLFLSLYLIFRDIVTNKPKHKNV